MIRKRIGFSLIELLVALAILAAVTTLALRSLDGLQNQARYQQTTRQLDEVRNAIVGQFNGRNPDGTPLVTGFVADVGRLPQYVAGNDPLLELTTPNGISLYSPVAATSDNSIRIFTGWQGPYLRLSSGSTTIHDGWGKALRLYDSANNPVTSSASTIAQITSWCADNNADPTYGGTGDITGYNLDVGLSFPATGLGSYQAQISGTVVMLDQFGNPTVPNTTHAGNAVNVWICYYGPNGNGGVVEVTANANAATGQYTISGTSITLGNRVFRAYVIPTSFAAFNSTSVAGKVVASQALNVVAIGGSQTVSSLVLPYYAP